MIVTSNRVDIASVGADSVGLAAQLCASMFSPTDIFIIDINLLCLQTSKEIMVTPGLEDTNYIPINNKYGSAVDQVIKVTKGNGVDLAVEVIGIPDGWYMS